MKGVGAFLIFLFIIPLGHILTANALRLSVTGQVTVILIALLTAVALMYFTKYVVSEAWETFWGLIAGVLLWASLFEMGFRLWVKTFNLDDIKSVELTLILLVPLLLYLFFNEAVRCTLFVNLRTMLKPQRRPCHAISVDRWCPRTAVKVFLTMWIGHVVLYFVFDNTIFGERGFMTKFLFGFCLFSGSYLFYSLTRAEEMGFALRYTIPTVVIIWSCVETIGRWRKYPDPFSVVDPFFMGFVSLSALLLIYSIIRSTKKRNFLQ